jgi:serine/threonine-protein phosphatase PGAM5
LASTLLYLVRHAEQAHSPAGDEPDGGISALGEQQAHRLGRRLANVPFDVVRHSPLRRAVQTAQILASYLPGIPVNCSELLRDRTPIPSASQAGMVPLQYRPFLGNIPAAERDTGAAHLTAAVEQLAIVDAGNRHELLVTHNFVIGWFVRHALDAPAWRWMGLNQFNCALTIIEIQPHLPPMLITFNDIGHLPLDLRGHAPIALRS